MSNKMHRCVQDASLVWRVAHEHAELKSISGDKGVSDHLRGGWSIANVIVIKSIAFCQIT